MNSTLLVNIFRFILLLAVQIVILTNEFSIYNAALSAVYYFISSGNRSGL
jgi:hypothetical protein